MISAVTRAIGLLLAPLRSIDDLVVSGALANARGELRRNELRRYLERALTATRSSEETPISA